MKKLVLEKKEVARCAQTISRAINDYVSECGAKGAVMGLSGGIDSAVVFKLACMSGTKVHAMIMPEEGISSPGDVADAIALAEGMQASYSLIKVNKAIDALDSSFPWKDFDIKKRLLTLGNAKARLRMIYNYMAANCGELIVLGTGNRTEILLGYATKHGDAGVDIQPIGALYKTQVRQLASFVGVPRAVIDKAPTAGLWKGQTDEGELGASYDVMDRVLFCLVEEGRSIKETSGLVEADETLVAALAERIRRNEHKRCPPPVVHLFD